MTDNITCTWTFNKRVTLDNSDVSAYEIHDPADGLWKQPVASESPSTRSITLIYPSPGGELIFNTWRLTAQPANCRNPIQLPEGGAIIDSR